MCKNGENLVRKRRQVLDISEADYLLDERKETIQVTDLYSIDVYTDNYLPSFSKTSWLFCQLINYFLLLGCVNIGDTILVYFQLPNRKVVQGGCDGEIQLFNPFSL